MNETPRDIVNPSVTGETLADRETAATVWVALHAYELIWWREERAATRTPLPQL
jgi:hypothetical protein